MARSATSLTVNCLHMPLALLKSELIAPQGIGAVESSQRGELRGFVVFAVEVAGLVATAVTAWAVREARSAPRWPLQVELLPHAGAVHVLPRQAIITTGGVEQWAPLFPDVAPLTRRRAPRNWNEQRIRTELQDVLQDCKVFPARQDFAARDQERLYGALIRHGGVQHWAHEFDLPTART